MGVPKFFRWISERYPAISQLINESRIPEFDCFYLDMNGIIHNCTHKDSDTATTRMSEEEMFRAIFNYIEHLFNSIKPKKLFFMAIDGVAPRAKMNQQRSRRFRTALDAEKARDKAIQDGVEMPTEDPFDSNCITPGTEFMAKLSEQLRYFVNRKVSEDIEWQGVEIVLSGHEVPGEGEHKIMEYIRQAKSQPVYDSNRRHCLYGLDADLIMLGLLSHDPHFCLLREEVTFGRNSKKTQELQYQNFYLLHLCMVREYLELEFQELKEPGILSFPFDLERIIDDFILMAFFIGNDFLPNLPFIHITDGAFALMFDLYKKILPKAGGYLNENGTINLPRVGLLIRELQCVEKKAFEMQYDDASWIPSTKNAPAASSAPISKKGALTITPSQRDAYHKVKHYIAESLRKLDSSVPLTFPVISAEDRKFVQELATKLNLQWTTPEDSFGDRYLELTLPIDLAEITSADELNSILPSFAPVYKKYDGATVVAKVDPKSNQKDTETRYNEALVSWKNDYYREKFGWDSGNKEELHKLTSNYVQGLQWVLFYYYRGIASWPWFYQYHYSPMISDVESGFDVDLNFKLGVPFRPYEQLMGVLPDRSKKIVPPAYRDLMTNPESPIIDFYPREFELDMNGKKMEWEAIVKIPFIEEDRLLRAMAPREDLLTEDERSRNAFGYATVFNYDPTSDFLYMSPMPGLFPDVIHCKCTENIFEPPPMEGLDFYNGLVEGAQLGDKALAGFPSLRTLSYSGNLDFHGVAVFQYESRNQSIVATLTDIEHRSAASYATKRLGKSVYVRYPFLTEAKVVKVSDEAFDYLPGPSPDSPPVAIPHTHIQASQFHRSSDRLETYYSKKLGIIVGTVEAIVHVELLKGLRKTPDGASVKEFAANTLAESEFPAQVIVDDVFDQDSRFIEKAAVPVEEEFPMGSIAIFLGPFAYGQPARVFGYSQDDRVDVEVFHAKMPQEYYSFGKDLCAKAEQEFSYVRLLDVAKKLNIRGDVLNAIVSTVFVRQNGNAQKTNLGINLKFDFHKQKILHYSRHRRDGWEFSSDAVKLIESYVKAFPDLVQRLHNLTRRAGARVFASVVHSTSDLFSDDVTKQINEIRSWVKQETTDRNLIRVPLDALQLDSIQVGIVEAKAATFPPVQPSPVVLRNVPRHALLKSLDAEQRLGQQNFDLGDRVEYVLSSGTVPIGRLGTVVGVTSMVHSVLLDIVFDMEIESGTTLDGRCQQKHGQSILSTSVLNLTDRQLTAPTKASSERGQTPKEPRSQNRFDSGQSFQARNGQTFRAAPTPAPLRGSFSSATQGPPRRGRGGFETARGGANSRSSNTNDISQSFQSQLNIGNSNNNWRQQGGSYRPGPGQGKGQGQDVRGGQTTRAAVPPPLAGLFLSSIDEPAPQSYNAVPPPSSLNSSGGRGGRGGGRYRGARGRGGRGDGGAF